MGFEKIGEIKFLGLTASSRHKRSKSFPDKNRAPEDGSDVSPKVSQGMKQGLVHVEPSLKTNKKPSSNSETHDSLKQEILQLEKRLQDQFQVRHVLEKALGYQTCSHDNASDVSMPKPATELIKEIATLELEVAHLEQYLLSLYRKAFDQQVSSVSPSTKDASSKDKRLRTPKDIPRARLFETPPSANAKRREDSAVPSSVQPLEIPLKDAHGLSEEEKLLHSGVHRCHSALSHRSALEVRISPREESLGKAVRACHSQPLSMIEFARKAGTSVVSLAEYLGTTVSDHVPESASRLSEDMIKCMSSIYCKLADPPLANQGLSSPNSSLSSASAFSPQDQSDMWSPGLRNNSSFDVRLDNPFHVEGLKEFSGPYSTMVEVPWIHRDSQKLGDIEPLLQNYRSLICRLEEVDPRKLRHEEKVAFWINIHNALVMHAFLAYGIPQNNVKRVFQLLKAAYNVGGHTISADTIQSTILGCRMSRPGQWLRLLLSPKKRFKTRDERQAYGIKHSEPLLHFALCFGSHSDPAVRIYTPKGLSQELETAKDEYVRATFGVRKDKKILLPKTVESFAKDSGLCAADIIEMVQKCLPDSLRKSLKKCPVGKSSKSIEWIPYNFSFRYLIAKELAK